MTGFRLTKQIFTVLTVVIVFGLVGVGLPNPYGEAQASTLSGRVMDTKGEPIAEASIALLYVKVSENGEMDTLFDRSLYPFLRQRPAHRHRHFDGEEAPHQDQLSEHPPFLESKTDLEGRFTFTDIATGMVQLMVLPMEKEPVPQNFKPAPDIQSIRFGKVTFQPHDFSFFPPIGAVTFAIKPGVNIENVEVKVLMEGPPKIQGSLVFKNGEPLANASVKIDICHLDLEEVGDPNPVFSRSLHTDSDGNFAPTIYVLGTYSLSVNYRGLSAVSGPFIVEAEKPPESVVLALNGNSADLSELPAEEPEERRYGVPDIPGMWIVNPANGHAYKWVVCDGWKDAQAKAADEEAHLVTITSEAEQIWLEAVFAGGPYWIGLTDVLKEGEWLWETGEPVTYTNWKGGIDMDEDVLNEPPALFKAFGAENGRQREEDERQDFAIMSSQMDRAWENEIGKWRAVEARGGHHGRVQMAILEKDGMRSKVHGLSLTDIVPDEE